MSQSMGASGRRWIVLAMALALAACAPSPPAKPAPKPAPEPPQATPSAEALGPVRIADQACDEPPENGQVLEGAVPEGGTGFYEIKNLTNAKGVVKIRNAASGTLVAAVYVAPNQTATIGPLPDGTYRTSFAMGGDFAPDCSRLDYPSGYGQSERSDTFATTPGDGRPKGRAQTYSFEESDVDGGDGPQALTAEKFNAP